MDQKTTADDLEKLAEEVGAKPPRGLVCCICGDTPQRVNLKGLLFCGSCYKEIYS